MCCPTSKVIKSMYSDALAHAVVPYQAFHYSILPLPIALAFGRGAVAKPSRGFSLQYRLLIALAFERGTVVRLSRHDQAHRLTVKRLGHVGSHFFVTF